MTTPDITPRRRSGKVLFLAGLLLTFALLAGWRLDAPWTRGHEGNAGLAYGSIARHWQANGFGAMRGAQIRTVEPVKRSEILDAQGTLRADHLRESLERYFWTSRLPLGALLQAAGPWILGDRPAALRIVPILAAMGMIAVLLVLGGRLLDERAGTWMALALALNPGAILIARQPGYEWPCLFFSTLTFLLYELHRRRQWPLWPVLTAAALAGLAGWFGLYATLIVLAADILSRSDTPAPGTPRARLVLRGGLLLIPVGVCALYALYLRGLGQPLEERLHYFWTVRSAGSLNGQEADGLGFGVIEYLHTLQKHLFNHITAIPIMLAAGWTALWLRARKRGETWQEARLAAMCLAFALMCYLITLRASHKHRFYVMWWLPFIAVTGGCFAARLTAMLNDTRRRIAIAVLVAALAAGAAYKVIRYHQKTRGDEPLKELLVQSPACPRFVHNPRPPVSPARHAAGIAPATEHLDVRGHPAIMTNSA